MVGGIYFIDMPYSDFKQFKARPVLPLITNLKREGIIITKDDIEKGSLKKDNDSKGYRICLTES